MPNHTKSILVSDWQHIRIPTVISIIRQFKSNFNFLLQDYDVQIRNLRPEATYFVPAETGKPIQEIRLTLWDIFRSDGILDYCCFISLKFHACFSSLVYFRNRHYNVVWCFFYNDQSNILVCLPWMQTYVTINALYIDKVVKNFICTNKVQTEKDFSFHSQAHFLVNQYYYNNDNTTHPTFFSF